MDLKAKHIVGLLEVKKEQEEYCHATTFTASKTEQRGFLFHSYQLLIHCQRLKSICFCSNWTHMLVTISHLLFNGVLQENKFICTSGISNSITTAIFFIWMEENEASVIVLHDFY